MPRRKPTETDAVDVETFAARLTNRQLHCRELGHVWATFTATVDHDARVFVRTLRCKSCHTERRQLLTLHGGIVSNTYRYAAGYQAKNVDGQVAGRKDVFRLESVLRFMHERERRAG